MLQPKLNQNSKIYTLLLYIVQMQRLGYKKIAREIRGCHENTLANRFDTNPHMIWPALSL